MHRLRAVPHLSLGKSLSSDMDVLDGPEYQSQDSNTATRVRFVGDRQELRGKPCNSSNSSQPVHSDQIFDGGKIYGYRNPSLLLYFSKATLKPYYEFSHDGEEHATGPVQGTKRFLLSIFHKRTRSDSAMQAAALARARSVRRTDASVVSKHLRDVDRAKTMGDFLRALDADQNATMVGKRLASFTCDKVDGLAPNYEVRMASRGDPRVDLLARRASIVLEMFREGPAPIHAPTPAPTDTSHVIVLYELIPGQAAAVAGVSFITERYLHPHSTSARVHDAAILPHYAGRGLLFRLLYVVLVAGPGAVVTVHQPSGRLFALELLAHMVLVTTRQRASARDDVLSLLTAKPDLIERGARRCRMEPHCYRRALVGMLMYTCNGWDEESKEVGVWRGHLLSLVKAEHRAALEDMPSAHERHTFVTDLAGRFEDALRSACYTLHNPVTVRVVQHIRWDTRAGKK